MLEHQTELLAEIADLTAEVATETTRRNYRALTRSIRMSSEARALVGYLIDMWPGRARLSYADAADEMGTSRKSFQAAARWLVEVGMVRVVVPKAGRYGNVYELVEDPLAWSVEWKLDRAVATNRGHTDGWAKPERTRVGEPAHEAGLEWVVVPSSRLRGAHEPVSSRLRGAHEAGFVAPTGGPRTSRTPLISALLAEFVAPTGGPRTGFVAPMGGPRNSLGEPPRGVHEAREASTTTPRPGGSPVQASEFTSSATPTEEEQRGGGGYDDDLVEVMNTIKARARPTVAGEPVVIRGRLVTRLRNLIAEHGPAGVLEAIEQRGVAATAQAPRYIEEVAEILRCGYVPPSAAPPAVEAAPAADWSPAAPEPAPVLDWAEERRRRAADLDRQAEMMAELTDDERQELRAQAEVLRTVAGSWDDGANP